MELGTIEQGISAQAANLGRTTPQAISNKPEMLPGNALYLNAFYDLDGERHIGMSVGRIPWSAVQRYADHHEFDPDQCHALHMLVQSMDAVHLNHLTAKLQPKDTNASKPN